MYYFNHLTFLPPACLPSASSPIAPLKVLWLISRLLTLWALFCPHLSWFLSSISPCWPFPPSWNSPHPCLLWYFLLIFLTSFSQTYNLLLSPQTLKTLAFSRSLLCLYPQLGWACSLLPLYQYAVLQMHQTKFDFSFKSGTQSTSPSSAMTPPTSHPKQKPRIIPDFSFSTSPHINNK